MKKEDFDVLWDTVISKEANILAYNSTVIFYEASKSAIYNECAELMHHCKFNYMDEPEDKFIDRHKVAAAVMISILRHTPLKIVSSIFYDEKSKKPAFNEHLAITVGLSIILSFIKAEIANKYHNDDVLKREKLQLLADGIVLPKTEHGDYRNNWANELYYTRKEGAYNLLALAHELFFLEKETIDI